jgi:tetratricopeptide (TPR) repeat protein
VGQHRLKLTKLLFLSGQHQRAREQWLWLLQHGGMDLLTLPLLGNEDLVFLDQDEQRRAFAAQGVVDPLVDVGNAALAMREKDHPRAKELVDRVLLSQPRLADAQVLRGQLLFATGQTKPLRLWFQEQQELLDASPEFWVLQGRVCRAEGQLEPALRCFAEGDRRAPNDYVAVSQTGQVLGALDREAEAQAFLDRAGVIQDYAQVCRLIHVGELPSEPQLRQAVALSESLGGLREAEAWCQVAAILFPKSAWPLTERARLKQSTSPGSGRHEPGLLTHNASLRKLPLPRWTATPDQSDHIAQAAIQFEDCASRAGIDFVYEDGADPATPETSLFEFTGGGVAVIDIEPDGLPDLYFTQGGPPPPFGSRSDAAHPGERPTDRLYRNQADGTFQDVTLTAGSINRAYAQGCTAGDFDSDGFPDLYVANIGQNVLFRNNGDGTFSEHPSPAFAEAEAWTTSCLLADLNGDGHPDLYDVNHVIREGVHTQMCQRSGTSVPCGSARGLKAEQDRLLINLGTGEFQDVTRQCGIVAADGLGLGIVAADFDDSGRLSLFVANDAKPNFFFVNTGTESQVPRFEEQAVLRGLAYSAAGRAQACMGVAAGDANHDGLLDLFVTNFYADYNTLYLQQPGQFFDDATAACGLERVSWSYLGFGTQFLDADLDGDLDLVLTNGDVVDFSASEPGRHYAQQPQFLRNTGRRFELVPGDTLGEFFTKRWLGRGLARLDWDDDGRPDFVVSHIGLPAALLRNTSPSTGHFVKIRLTGTRSARDAFGTRVTLSTPGQSWTQQLTAGDGYMACNQRELLFGLGTETTLAELTVKWPSGTVERYTDLPVDQTIHLIEGARK